MIDMLIAAGVPCPSDIKRKLAMSTQKTTSRGRKQTDDDMDQSENFENPLPEKSKD
jgi:hypothetical protein